MSTLTIRNVDEHVHQLLRERAARHGRSVEAEVRGILVDIVRAPERNLLLELHARSARHGAELDLPTRTDLPRAVELP